LALQKIVEKDNATKKFISMYFKQCKIEMEIYHSGRRKSPSSCGKALQSKLSAGKTMGSERK
jgi:hypothetical protein